MFYPWRIFKHLCLQMKQINKYFMKSNSWMLQERGHTLIEIIVVLVILSILASFAVPRMIDVEKSTTQKVIQAIIPELNSREILVWAKI